MNVGDKVKLVYPYPEALDSEPIEHLDKEKVYTIWKIMLQQDGDLRIELKEDSKHRYLFSKRFKLVRKGYPEWL